jgi:hypothetical protein
MARTRKTATIIKEAYDWLGSMPGLMRLESCDKTAEEQAELAAVAAVISRAYSQLAQRWHRQQREKQEQISA